MAGSMLPTSPQPSLPQKCLKIAAVTTAVFLAVLFVIGLHARPRACCFLVAAVRGCDNSAPLMRLLRVLHVELGLGPLLHLKYG